VVVALLPPTGRSRDALGKQSNHFAKVYKNMKARWPESKKNKGKKPEAANYFLLYPTAKL
jgi:hypothetical protein